MKYIIECSFDWDGRSYEYEFEPSGGRTIPLTDNGDIPTQLYALVGPQAATWTNTIAPKEFKVLRVRRIKPESEKEFSGDLKQLYMLFHSEGPGEGLPLYHRYVLDQN